MRFIAGDHIANRIGLIFMIKVNGKRGCGLLHGLIRCGRGEGWMNQRAGV
jgi:hypothetical protein